MKKIFLASLFLILTSCGFSPIYGQYKNSDYNAKDLLQYITITNIPDREGQFLRNSLIDRFYTSGYPQNNQYKLDVSNLRENLQDLDLTRASDSTRGQLRIDVTITLTDNITGEALLQRNLRSITSYNILESEFSTRISEDSARTNAIEDIARQIEQQLVLYFQKQHQKSN